MMATLLLFVLISPLAFFFSACAYRLWVHPLAAHPGPFWARITDLYHAYHSWKGDLHLDMWRCHQKYGDYVRYGPNCLMYNNAESLQDLYSFGKKLQKSKGYLTMMHRVPNTITQRDKALHAKQRRLLSQGFSDSALRSYEQRIHHHVEILCEQLSRFQDQWSPPVDMSAWSDYLAFDIMLEIIYGRQANMLTKPDHRYLLDAIRESNIRVGVLMPLWYLKGRYVERFMFPRSIMARYKFLSFVKSLLKDKETEISNANTGRSVYSVIKGSEENEGLGPNEIAAESTNLVVAGSDTTATVLAASIFYLSRNLSAYEKAASEIRSCFQHPSDLQDHTRLGSCSYLRACINESLRMAPPIGSALFREVEPGGAFIDKRFVPAGVDIGTSVYSLHHHNKYFSDPFQFIPERWVLVENGSNREEIERAQRAFMPFSIGPRGCIGKSLALMELQSTLASLLFYFNFRIADGNHGHIGEGKKCAEWGRHRENEYQLYAHLTATREGPFVQFQRRISKV